MSDAQATARMAVPDHGSRVARLRLSSLGLVIMLIIQFILGVIYSLYGTGPTATKSVGMFSSPVLALHVILFFLLVIAAVVQSFSAFPVSGDPFAFLRAVEPQRWGAEIFSLGLWIALPLVAMLLFTNLILGVVSRVAQQMNVFAIGFPITLGVGLVGVLLTLPVMEMPFTMALERMLANFR